MLGDGALVFHIQAYGIRAAGKVISRGDFQNVDSASDNIVRIGGANVDRYCEQRFCRRIAYGARLNLFLSYMKFDR